MLTLVFATALAAAPAPAPMPCAADCTPQAMADCPMGQRSMTGMPRPESGRHSQDHADRR